MKANKWNVKITKNGRSTILSYDGFSTKKKAQAVADQWNAIGFKAEVIQ